MGDFMLSTTSMSVIGLRLQWRYQHNILHYLLKLNQLSGSKFNCLIINFVSIFFNKIAFLWLLNM